MITINGNARVIDEETINITLKKDDIHKLRTNKSGDFFQFHIKKRYKADLFGNTHTVHDGHCKDKPSNPVRARSLKDNWCDEDIPPHVSNTAKSTLDLF